MTNLIKVTYENERPTVMGRDLHNFLGVTERYSSWFERMQQYGFAETIDYLGCKVFNTLRKEKKKMENYIPKEEAKGYIVIDVDTSQVVEATKKAKKLLKLLKKANSLADELASKEILLNIDVQC